MAQERTNVLTIRTPEGISFGLALACPITRFLAWSIDLACIVAIMVSISIVLGALGSIAPGLFRPVATLLYFGVSIGYGIVAEWFWRGQTLGKRVMKLRVVDCQGLRLQASQIVIRNLLRAVDLLPAVYLVGGVVCLFSRHAQRVGDHAANTVVVRAQPRLNYDPAAIAAGKYNSFRDYPHLEARLRQKTSPQEAAIALQALLRREQIEPADRVVVFQEIASRFRELVSFPEEASVGITDEQYVRNAVETLFRPTGTSV